MNLESFTRNLKVLLRAERILADIRLHQAARRAGLTVTAGAFALFGCVMIGVAGFLALQTLIGPILAALTVGLAALTLAALLAAAAAGASRPGRDHEVAQSLEAAALDALAADAKGIEAEIRGYAGFLRNPLDGALPGMILPLATMLLKALRRKETKTGGAG